MSRQQRIGFALVAVVIAVIAVIVLSAGGSDDAEETAATPTATQTRPPAEASPLETPEATATEEPAPEVTEIEVEGSKVKGGEERIQVDQGDTVRFAVTSDVADEVHVHGYDLSKEVKAGGRVRFTFEADIVGIFEVELEHAHLPIAQLRVNQ